MRKGKGKYNSKNIVVKIFLCHHEKSFSGASAGATGTADVAGVVGVLAGGLAVPLGYCGSVVCLRPLVQTLNTAQG
jgi:hypothetical protein